MSSGEPKDVVESASGGIEISLDAVIVAVTNDAPRVLTVEGPDGLAALPAGLLAPEDHTLERGLRRWVHDQTGLDVGYVEQLYTFGDRARSSDGSPPAGSPNAVGVRSLSIAYLALVREEQPMGTAAWRNVYDFFPWEDHRGSRPALIDDTVMPSLAAFAAGDAERAERVRIVFGDEGGGVFDGIRVLERYELLFEAGLLGEVASSAMYLDHRRIAATALGRLRGKLSYRPVVFELLPDRFTLLHLQQVVEALAGLTLHKQNFRRLVEGAGLVEGTGELTKTAGRPAELFRFRREVLGERPAPGVGTSWVRS